MHPERRAVVGDRHQAAELFAGGAGQGAKQKIVSSATGQARKAAPALRFFGYLAYALVIALAIPAAILLGLLVTRPRPRRMVRS